MKGKELLIAAIEEYSFYTKAQRRLLKTLVEVEENNIIKSSVLELSLISNMSRASVYRCIDTLKKDSVLRIPESAPNTLSLFTLNKNKLEEIEKNYIKKLSLLKNEKILQKEFDNIKSPFYTTS